MKLTAYGEKLFESLTRQRVPYPEARLLCFLELMHLDLLVDPLETDRDALVAAIGDQIKSGDLRYPFVYGRLLYDRVADLALSNERSYLSEKETDEVLADTPQGVFQVGVFVTGPYGLLKSQSSRYIEPILSVPYHCSDMSCSTLHRYALRTALDAPINESRDKVRKTLQRESVDSSAWSTFLTITNKDAPKFIYDDLVGDPLVFIIGDALTIEEQRSVLAWLLDNTKGYLRGVAQAVGVRGRAADMTRSLNAAEIMQLIFLCSNKAINSALDALAKMETIRIPEGEVRTAVVNNLAVGPYNLFAELNRYGVRLRSATMNLAPLRFRRLVGQMYPFDDEPSRIELDYQLREEVADTLEAKIEEFLQKRRPREAVSRLVLPRYANVVIATEKLGIDSELFRSDQDRVNAAMWKLGFSLNDVLDVHGQFWLYHDAMMNACRPAPLGPSLGDIEQIRERSNNYFVTLEAILRDSLLYTAWALTTDHYASSHKFTYRPHVDEESALQTLKSFVEEQDSDYSVRLEEPLTLFPLISGFRILADYLAYCLGSKDEFQRDVESIPLWAHSQEIQRFPFVHTIPFLDLLPESQGSIMELLKETSRALLAAEVSDVRNELAHPRRPDVPRIRHALTVVEEALISLREHGFFRQVFREVRTEVDEAARATTIFADPYGREVVVHDPSYFDWLDLPQDADGTHFMTSACFYQPNVVLRFKTQLKSPYSELWANYPRRPLKPEGSDGSYRVIKTSISALPR